MKFLLDTNAVIPAEPTSVSSAEPGTPIVSKLLGLISHGKHQPYIHPASISELQGDKDTDRRKLRLTLVEKYPILPAPPPESDFVISTIGAAAPGSHDEVDHLLLSAVLADAVDYLVSDDAGIHKKAKRLGVPSRVLSLADAVAAVRGLSETVPSPPPAVEFTVCHGIDTGDPIFDSFRSEYDDFDSWFRKCKLEHRNAWVVRSSGGAYAGICIIKHENSTGFDLAEPVLKICSFKISDNHRGYRFGELMLKAIFEFAAANDFVTVYVTAFPHHHQLISLFEMFGFEQQPALTGLGELVLAKRMVCSRSEYESLSPLEVHVRFGPPLFKSSGADVFVVPIQPRYHSLLFPELDEQIGLFRGSQPFGNSIMKAYLCHAQTRQITPGSTLLFYQSQTTKSVATVGVVEETLVSNNADEIARFVGKRTVYSYAEITSMCRKQVLTILFRQAQVFDPPYALDLLLNEAVLNGPPQSIVRVGNQGELWLAGQIETPH